MPSRLPSLRRVNSRFSLLHLAGMPWARIGELVAHDDLSRVGDRMLR